MQTSYCHDAQMKVGCLLLAGHQQIMALTQGRHPGDFVHYQRLPHAHELILRMDGDCMSNLLDSVGNNQAALVLHVMQCKKSGRSADLPVGMRSSNDPLGHSAS